MNKRKREDTFFPVLIMGAAGLVIVAFLIFAFVNARQIRLNNQQYLINDTKQVAHSLDQVISDGYTNIKVLSELIGETLHSPQVNIKEYQDLIQDSVFDFIEFVDKDGVNHNITGGQSDARDRQYYLEGIHGNSGMTVLYNSRATHENLMAFYAPVYYEGEIIGSLVGMHRGSQRFTKILLQNYFGELVESYMINEEGQVFASTRKINPSLALFIDNALNADAELSNQIKTAIREKKNYSFVMEKSRTGGFITPLKESGWYLLQIYPPKANEKMINSLNAIGLSLVALLLFIFLVLFFVIRKYYIHQQEKEAKLVRVSNTDELTGCFNRKAYEDDLRYYPSVPPEANYVYVAMDLNGLKQINDNLGHEAGDELIIGAANTMRRCLGNYGRVYRIGGDEFAAMIFADEVTLEAIKEDFIEAQDQWQGRLVDRLSISSGYVTKREYPGLTVTEMANIADKRMYEAKAEYYKQKGVDRKSQQAAHTALCSLYTKVLKINLTKDSYQIVNMDLSEQYEAKGFSDKISEWLQGFGLSGQVHPEDLANYLEQTKLDRLQNYFKGNKLSWALSYRRKYQDDYKQVVMEMIPANDYSDDNQSIFLYVKAMER